MNRFLQLHNKILTKILKRQRLITQKIHDNDQYSGQIWVKLTNSKIEKMGLRMSGQSLLGTKKSGQTPRWQKTNQKVYKVHHLPLQQKG